MERGARIWIAGGGSFLGRALARRLRTEGLEGLVGAGEGAPDLRDPAAVESFFARERPEYVFLLGGRSGGIGRNLREPADLMLHNLRIETSVLPAAHRHGVRKLLYLAAACIYPRECEQPMRPAQLGSGPLEPTSEAYAMAKWAGLVLCRAYARQHGAPFVTAIPANPFGPGADTARRAATSSKPCSSACTARASAATPRSSSGAAAARCATGSTWTTSPTPACS